MLKANPLKRFGFLPQRISTLVLLLVLLFFPTRADALPYKVFVQQLKRQLSLQPRSARLHTILAQLYARSGKRDLASRHYKLALKYKPGYPHARAGVAQLLVLSRSWTQADKLLTAVLKRHPRLPLALATRSDWYRLQAPLQATPSGKKKFYEASIQWLLRAVKARPDLTRYRFRLALLLLGRRQYWKAHFHFLKLVEKDKERPCHRLGLALCESFFDKRWKRSLARIQKQGRACAHPMLLRLIQPLQLSLRMQIAKKTAQAGQWNEAIRLLKKALRPYTKFSSAHSMLAWWIVSQRGCKEAMLYLRPFHKQRKTSASLRSMIRQLKRMGCHANTAKKTTKR